MRLAYYAGASTAAAAACLLKAFHERPNFYSATVYLSQSNACLLILTNLLLVCAVTFMYGLQRILYGPLRPIEIEQLSEKAWYAVLDTLLAMPSFREDVGGWLLTMFVLLLAGKVWGWIAEGRVDVLEQQPPANPRLFHARLATSLLLSVGFDLYMTYYCFETVVADPRPGMMVIFTFEFAILTIFSVFTLLRYQLNVIATEVTRKQTLKAIEERKREIQAERAAAADQEGAPPASDEPIDVDENEVDVPGWEEKRRYLFALEVFTDFTKLVLYIVFFTVSITFNGLPMHIMRDVYMTFASFSKRLSDYVNYKKATSDMNARYPDATSSEIRDDSCIVCRETMVAWEEHAAPGADGAPAGEAVRPRRDEGLRAKKLPCGHILHLRCLKAWLERQQVCPTCRRPVLTSPIVRPPQVPAVAGAQNPAAPAGPAPAARNDNNAARPPNRARFFNLGPVRIGFLNGPVGQINDIVNQLQGRPAQPEANHNRQPAVDQAQAAAAGATTSQNQVSQPSGTRLTQADISQMQLGIMREVESLAVDRAQLQTLQMMCTELSRLQALQSRRDLQHTLQAQHGPGTQSQGSRAVTASLSGHPEQRMTAVSGDLPQGVTLPPGWSLMPLHAQTYGGVRVDVSSNAHMASQMPAMPLQPNTGNQTAPQADTSLRTPTSVHELNTDVGPTDSTGSPLFVPATTSATVPTAATTSSVSPNPDTRVNGTAVPPTPATKTDATTQAVQPNGAAGTSTPWSSSGWDFDNATASSETGTHLPESSDSPSEGRSNGKGKARAVEVEDVPETRS